MSPPPPHSSTCISKVKPKRRYFQRLRRWTGFDQVLVKFRRWQKQKLREALGKILGFDDINMVAYNLLYEMQDIIDNNKKLLIPKIATIEQTVNELIHTDKSFTRFGDGEFGMMFLDAQLGFQRYDKDLPERLKEVLVSPHPNLMIGLPDFFGALYAAKSLSRSAIGEIRDHINPFLNAEKQYYNASTTRVTNSEEHFLRLKKIWEGKKIVTIEGRLCRLGVGNDLFDNVASLRRILAPAECAFGVYGRIFQEALKVERDVLFLIALGPTATLLAHDLCAAGYRALDIGHLDICYELFCRGESRMVAIEGKYVGEASHRSPGACKDPAYLSQVIAEIELP